MYGYISGYSDTDDISFCPGCGERVYQMYADGTCKCDACQKRFAVIEIEDE